MRSTAALSVVVALVALLTSSKASDVNNNDRGSLTPGLLASSTRHCYATQDQHPNVDEFLCQRTFRDLLNARHVDHHVRWGPHFHSSHWQASDSQCAIYVFTRDFYRGEDRFTIREVLNTAIQIVRDCNTDKFGGWANVGTRGYFYVEVLANNRLYLPQFSPPASNDTAMSSAGQQQSTGLSSRSKGQGLKVSNPGIECKELGQARVTSADCTSSLELIKEEDIYSYRKWGPHFQPRSWQARRSHCAITLQAQDSIHGTDWFALSAALHMSKEILKTCAMPGYGGIARLGTHHQFILAIDGSTTSTQVSVANADSNLTSELTERADFENDLSIKNKVKRKRVKLAPPEDRKAQMSLLQRTSLKKTPGLECDRRPNTHPVSAVNCNVAIDAVKQEITHWGTERQLWSARGALQSVAIWRGPSPAQHPCFIELRSGHQKYTVDKVSYADVLDGARRILETCGSRGGSAEIGARHFFQAVISRNTWSSEPQPSLGHLSNSMENASATVSSSSTPSNPTASPLTPTTVPSVVEQSVGIMKASSMLTMNSNQLTLRYMCHHPSSGEGTIPRLDSASCAKSLLMLTSEFPVNETQQHGPDFVPRFWHAPGTECLLVLLAAATIDTSQFSGKDIVNAVDEVLTKCNGTGGVARVAEASGGFFVGVSPWEMQSGPIGSVDLTSTPSSQPSSITDPVSVQPGVEGNTS